MAFNQRFNRDLLPSPLDYYAHKVDGWKMSGSHRAKCKCPFRSENTASMFIDLTTGAFKCFSCGEGGDMVKFHMLYTGLDFVDACTDLGAMQ